MFAHIKAAKEDCFLRVIPTKSEIDYEHFSRFIPFYGIKGNAD